MKKITKKQFIELLCTHQSALIDGNIYPVDIDDKISGMCNSIYDNENGSVWRQVTHATSRKITFSGGSSLSLSDFGEKSYYQEGSFIWQKNVIDYSQDNTCSYDFTRYGYVIYLLR